VLVRYSELCRTNADYDRSTLERYADLAAGGSQLRAHIDRYLPRHAPMEPVEVWKARLEAAHYLNYAGPIAAQLSAWLFTAPFQATPDANADEWWSAWREDCDGLSTDLRTFMRAPFLEALVSRSSWWQVAFPEGVATDAADWQAQGLGAARLVAIPALDVTAWRRDESGALEWVVTRQRVCGLEEWTDADEHTTETWTLWRADDAPSSRTARQWSVRYDKAHKPRSGDTIPEVAPPWNPVGGIPLVELTLPRELWLMDRIGDAALESLRKRNALSWALDKSAFSTPVLKRKDRKRPPPLGTGYYVELGVEESLEWAAPPSSAYDALGGYAATLKDELYRVVSLMASGVDNNAAAIGRSGESKSADMRATEIVLSAYGAHVREAAQRTYSLVSAGRGETLSWRVSGLDRYQVTDTTLLLDDAVKAAALGIPSATAQRELQKRAAAALLPDASEETLAAIRAEIDAAEVEHADETRETEDEPAGEDSSDRPEDAKPTEASAVAVDPNTALNGAQVASLLDVVERCATGQIPRETAVQLIVAAFPLDEAAADRLLGDVGRGFVPATTPAAGAAGAPPVAGTPAAAGRSPQANAERRDNA